MANFFLNFLIFFHVTNDCVKNLPVKSTFLSCLFFKMLVNHHFDVISGVRNSFR